MSDATEPEDTVLDESPAEEQELTVTEDTPEGEEEQGQDNAQSEATETVDDNASSSTTDNAEAPPVHDWEKRYKDLQREFTRRNEELKRYRETIGDNDPAEVMKRIGKFQEQEQHSQLPPWNPQSPHNGRFSQALSNYQTYSQQIQRADTPEKREVVADMWRDAFSDEDIRAIKAYQQFQTQEQQRLISDPSYLQQKIRQEAQEVAQAMFAQQQAVAHYQSFFSSPEIQPIVQKHGKAIEALMRGGMPAEQAIDYIKGMDAQQAMASVEADKKAAAAQAQRDLAKGKAQVTRDKTGQPMGDVLTEARKLCKQWGVPASGAKLMEAIQEIQSSRT